MDYYKLVDKIYGAVEFNSACFNFTEDEARAKRLWNDARAMPTQAQLDAAIALVDAEDQIQELYDVMVAEIYTEMYNVFGTNNDVSAQAFASTYEAMASRPANYVGQLGLVDEAAVIAYADARIVEADAYAIFRLNRIAQFQSERDAILNS